MFQKSNKVSNIFETQLWLYGCRSIQSKKEIHSNRKFGSHCFCKIKKPNKNFLKLNCICWCSYFDRTDDQTTCIVPFFCSNFFPVVIGVFLFDTTEGFRRFISTVLQTTVPFFSGCNFFRWFEKHIRPDDCTFFLVIIVLGCNWCSYFDTSNNYGTYIWPENITTRKKGLVVWPAMFFGGFKLQPEKVTTRKKRYSCLADGWNACFLAGSNYNRKQLRPEKKQVQSSGRRLK